MTKLYVMFRRGEFSNITYKPDLFVPAISRTGRGHLSRVVITCVIPAGVLPHRTTFPLRCNRYSVSKPLARPLGARLASVGAPPRNWSVCAKTLGSHQKQMFLYKKFFKMIPYSKSTRSTKSRDQIFHGFASL